MGGGKEGGIEGRIDGKIEWGIKREKGGRIEGRIEVQKESLKNNDIRPSPNQDYPATPVLAHSIVTSLSFRVNKL
jgi:hypothetical protein